MRLSRLSIARWLVAGSFIALAGTLSLPAQAQSAYPQQKLSPKATLQARQQAEEQTRALMAQYKGWQQARGADKSRALGKLVEQAEARQRLLAELAKTQPAEVLRVAIPADRQRGMPEEVLARLEQLLELEGEVSAFYIDHEDGRHHFERKLNTSFGESFELHPIRGNTELKMGDRVRVRGWLIPNPDHAEQGDIVLSDEEDSLVYLAAGADGSAETNPNSIADTFNTLGEQRTLVVLANFQDDPVQPWTRQQAQDLVFGSVNDFYRENSVDRTWLSGEVAGWYTLPLNSDVCSTDVQQIFDSFEQVAKANGVDVAAYDRHIYMFPKNSYCRWGGMGSFGGSPSKSLVNHMSSAYVTAHELGHNMGLHHARGLNCSPSVLGDNCTVSEYGDITDVMGIRLAHFNAYHKERLGWLSVPRVEQSGQYELSLYADPDRPGTKALKIYQQPSSFGDYYYYLSLRQGFGFDGSLEGWTNTPQGVVFQQGIQKTDNVRLLDMTPDSQSGGGDLYDPALEAGRSYVDAQAGVQVDVLSVSEGSALVYIDLAQDASCVGQSPAVQVAPSTQWGESGQTLGYEVTVTNRDDAACGVGQFELSATVPAGWIKGYSQSSLSLNPGESATVLLSVASDQAAQEGYYEIAAQASANGQSAQTKGTYVVDNPVASPAPVANDDQVVLSAVAPVVIDVLANDQVAEGKQPKVIAVTQPAKGSVVINSDQTLTYTPARSFKGSDSFGYTLSDGSQTAASAQVYISLSSESGATGGNGGKGKNR